MVADESSTSDPALELLELADGVASRAGAEARRLMSELTGGVGVRDNGALGQRPKSSATDPVTIVDTAVEEYIRSELATLRPGDAILGEEQGHTGAGAGVTWIVDPVDGTVNMMYGHPHFAVSIAAAVGDRVLAGVVHNIADEQTYSAALGRGASVRAADGNRRELRVSGCGDTGHALVGTGFAYDARVRAEQGAVIAHLLPRVRDIRRLGAAALDLCYLAAGRLDAYYERGLQPWDYAAGALVAREAGAWVETSADDDVPTIAAAPGVAEAFRQLLVEAGALSS